MSITRRATAVVAATPLLAVPVITLGATSAEAAEKQRRCGGAQMSFQVEREDGGHEVDADIDDATPGSRWRITVTKNGERLTRVVRTADSEGDLDVDRRTSNGAGTDRYVMRAKNLAGGDGCRLRVSLR